MPVQHNPHSHSIPCSALGVTLDAFVARELESAPESCAGCQCSLQLEAPDEGRVGAMNAYARLRPADEPNVVPVEKTKPDQSEADEATEAA